MTFFLGGVINSWKKIQSAMQQTHKPLNSPQQISLSNAMETAMQNGRAGTVRTQLFAMHETEALLATYKAMNAYRWGLISWIGEMQARVGFRSQLA